MRRVCLGAALLLGMLGHPCRARADAGVWDLGARATWISTQQGQLTAVSHLGVADAWAWYTEAGVRFNAANLLRPEVATGVTWVYDVFSLVPAATVAVGLVYPDDRASVLGLARAELRRYVTPRAFAAVLAGVEVTRAGWSAQAGVGFSWQLEKTEAP